MARLPVMEIVRSAVADLNAYKGLAAVLYAALLVSSLGLDQLGRYMSGIAFPLAVSSPVGVGALLLRASLYRFTFENLLPWLATCFVLAWVNTLWAEWVASRSDRGELGGHRFWPAFIALLKYLIILAAIFGFAAMLGRSGQPDQDITTAFVGGSGQAILSPDFGQQWLAAVKDPAGGTGAILGLMVALAGVVVAVRLLLLPARAAIGEGRSAAASWQATRGAFWSLTRLIVVNAAISVLGSAVSGFLLAVLAYLAVGAGLIAGPANLSLAGLMQWTGSPALATLSLVRSVLIIPVVGAVFFIFTGSLIRAALLLRHAPGNGHDAHARAPADLQPEQSVWH